jgi:hypothetical protein
MGFPESSARVQRTMRWNSGELVDVLGSVRAQTATMNSVTSYEGWLVGEEESCR